MTNNCPDCSETERCDACEDARVDQLNQDRLDIESLEDSQAR